MSVFSRRVAHLADRGANVRVGGATAEIPAHPFTDLRVGRRVSLLEKGDGGKKDEAAEAAKGRFAASVPPRLVRSS